MDNGSYGHWGAQDTQSSSASEDLWMLPEQNRHRDDMANQYWQQNFPVYPKPEFNPASLPRGHIDVEIFNAIYEIKEVWDYTVREAYHNYSSMYSNLGLQMDLALLKLICRRHKEAFAVYDRQLKSWLVSSHEPKYRYCYNGEDFEEFNSAKEATGGSRFLLVGKYTVLMQEPNLVHATEVTCSMVENFRRPSARLVVGVPGCGKTTYILNNHAHGNLVLTSSAEAAADIRSRMAALHGRDASSYRDSYRTIDSYLLNSRRPYEEVWIDEALMEHPGKLFLVCLFSRCQVVHMLGDPNQLGYICRLNGIQLCYGKAANFFEATEFLNTSYRCPVDVMAKISCKYDGGAYSTSHILHSVKCVEYTSLNNVHKDDETKYLVFKQAEKKVMARAGYKVSTIHEFQGKEAKDVIIVRMSRNVEPLYDSVPHILVGLSRHKESLVYYTPVRDDLYKIINMHLTDEQLLAHQKRTESSLEPDCELEITEDYESTDPSDKKSSMRNRNLPSVIENTCAPVTVVNEVENTPAPVANIIENESTSTPIILNEVSIQAESSLITVRDRVSSMVRWGVSVARRYSVAIVISICYWIYSRER